MESLSDFLLEIEKGNTLEQLAQTFDSVLNELKGGKQCIGQQGPQYKQ